MTTAAAAKFLLSRFTIFNGVPRIRLRPTPPSNERKRMSAERGLLLIDGGVGDEAIIDNRIGKEKMVVAQVQREREGKNMAKRQCSSSGVTIKRGQETGITKTLNRFRDDCCCCVAAEMQKESDPILIKANNFCGLKREERGDSLTFLCVVGRSLFSDHSLDEEVAFCSENCPRAVQQWKWPLGRCCRQLC